MAASTISNLQWLYKKLYADKVGDSAMRKHWLYNKVRKEGGFTGESLYYPIRTTNPQGIGSTFAGAQAAVSGSKGYKFEVERRKKYAVITLDGEAMAAASNDAGAFKRLVTTETDGVLEEFVDSLAFDFFRDGTGVRGQRSSINSNTITLATRNDVRNFKLNMLLSSGPNTDGSSLNTHTGNITVTGIDHDAGTITVSNAGNMGAFADNHYLFRYSDTGNVCMEGLAAHFPLTTPGGSDSFRGINRSVAPAHLAGSRVDDSTLSVEEVVRSLATKISDIGKSADLAVMNPIKFEEMVRRTNAKTIYEGGGGEATIGFKGITIATSAGDLTVKGDPDCPTDRVYVLNMSTLYIKHLFGLPHMISDDGKMDLRMANEDSIEARARAWSNLICTDPAANGVGKVY
jgi:hypothetical protein